MRIHFLGGATTVTGSQFLLETDQARVLIDCGMFQGSPSEAERNRLPFDFEPAGLDALLLTHAHLDHCGRIPALVRGGFRGPIHATAATTGLARLVLLDSGKIQVEQARDRQDRAERLGRRDVPPTADPGSDPEESLRSQPAELDTTIFEPLYTVEDAEASLQQFRSAEYGATVDVAPGVRATFQDAGHILGSAIIVVDAIDARPGAQPVRICFSGDLGRPNTPIIRDPTTMEAGADYVLVESTYGGREHEPGDEAVRLLAEAVRAVADHSGVLLIPAFAIGRTQELVWQLDRLLEAGSIPHVPLYLDSPMAGNASDVYRQYPGYYDDETTRLLDEGETPLDYPDQHVTRTAEESKAIAHAPRPMMIVSASGMLTGGRIVHHLRNLIDDPAALILFVGYQGVGTLGAHLQGGAREIKLDGQVRQVRCQVRSISGFSAHADESELLDWLRHFSSAARKPRRVFLIHGDPEASEALEGGVRALGLEPYRPSWREAVELT